MIVRIGGAELAGYRGGASAKAGEPPTLTLEFGAPYEGSLAAALAELLPLNMSLSFAKQTIEHLTIKGYSVKPARVSDEDSEPAIKVTLFGRHTTGTAAAAAAMLGEQDAVILESLQPKIWETGAKPEDKPKRGRPKGDANQHPFVDPETGETYGGPEA